VPNSRAPVRYPIAIILAIHGLIHLLGFVTAWEFAEVNELEDSTLFSLDPGSGPAQAFGLLWLLAALALVVAAVGLVWQAGWTGRMVGIAAAVSLVVTVVWWTDAWIGAVISAVVLAAVLAGPRLQRRWPPTPGATQPVA